MWQFDLRNIFVHALTNIKIVLYDYCIETIYGHFSNATFYLETQHDR